LNGNGVKKNKLKAVEKVFSKTSNIKGKKSEKLIKIDNREKSKLIRRIESKINSFYNYNNQDNNCIGGMRF
jgi:hypothetical protein